MIYNTDFKKKQIIFAFCNKGEKLSFSNDNLLIKTEDGKIKFQCTCYRLFIVYVIGHCSLTTAIIQKAKSHGFYIALLTTSFRIYALVGGEKDGNTLLKQRQYGYCGIEIAKHITKNKIENQSAVLKKVRDKSQSVKEAITVIEKYSKNTDNCRELCELLAYEGLSSKIYFKSHFNNILWKGRQPRIKIDMINSVLDIGYTLLFTFIDSLLSSFGFDTFCGVMHTQFYMRKSLVCDLMEPFRPIIDEQIKKSINLKQVKEQDFLVSNKQYLLKWEKSAEYISFLMQPIVDRKDEIFIYVQQYYRAFMKDKAVTEYPIFKLR